jgi:hypothetical protein
MRKREVLARLGGILPKAVRILRMARIQPLADQAAASSPAPRRLEVPARRLDAWTPGRVMRGGFLLAGPRSGGGDGGGGVGSKRSGADCGGSEDGGGEGGGGGDGAAGWAGGVEERRVVRSKAETIEGKSVMMATA